MPPPPSQPPSSILILGAGVFGLSTAYALTQDPFYNDTNITLVDRAAFPAPDASSIDSSRIIRADYADPVYASFAASAVQAWRETEFGAENRYEQSGLCIVLSEDETAVGRKSVEESLANVTAKLGLREGRREEGGEVEVLRSEEDVRRVITGMENGRLGREGYVNWTSGWADAEAGMRFLKRKIEDTGRVQFRVADIASLLFSNDATPKVIGARTQSDETLTADLTILALGAWTPRFIDLRGIASANGQILAYISLTPSEQTSLGGNPTLIDEGNGCFIIPPRNGVLKIARHGYGYANPTVIPYPEPAGGRAAGEETITVSLPFTKTDDANLEIPAEGKKALRAYLARSIPSLAEREWTHTRVCWYLDTLQGDWIVDFHPRYEGLVVAAAGSGHAYKFLPVLGERVVDVLRGRERDELGGMLRRKWRWPATRAVEDHVWTEDWRGGPRGMVLREELARR